MKKILAIILVFTFCFALFACSAETKNETTTAEETTEETVVSTTKKTTSSSSGSSGGSFTNKYGTRTTVCAVSGCSNYIAKSGDTNCCTTHSNKCLECRCYIDGDAMYCMDCIMSALS